MASQDRIRDLLGQGLTNEIVASAVGVTPSYISQLMGDKEFAGEVARLRLASVSADINRDKKLDNIEDKLITSLEQVVDMGGIRKPREILTAVQVLHQLKRRVPAIPTTAGDGHTTIINLTMPTQVIAQFKANAQGEVVTVDGQSTISMNAATLLKSKLLEGRDANQYNQLRKFLPETQGDSAGTGNKIINQRGEASFADASEG